MLDVALHIERVKSLTPLPPEQRTYERQLLDMKFSEAAAQIGYALAVAYVSYLERLRIATNGSKPEIVLTYEKFKKAEIAIRKGK